MGSLQVSPTHTGRRMVNLFPLQQHAGLQRPLKHQAWTHLSCPIDYNQWFHMLKLNQLVLPLLIVGPCVLGIHMTMCR